MYSAITIGVRIRAGVDSLASLIVVAIIMVAINCAPGVLARTLWLRFRSSPHQGLDTKDNVVVDWHDPAHVEIKNPA
ncbi:hypothetical protein ACNQUF_10440 [Corynebacterium diphtheriae]